MWVFGYGSLIWKVDFPYEKKVDGYIVGFHRRFWQGSVDHRGVPGKPGRVATLVPTGDNEKVWGVAYKIAEADIPAVMSHLNYREKDGYKQIQVAFHPNSSLGEDPFTLTLYIGQQDNPFYVGPAPMEEMAEQIFNAEGPSGKNKVYLFNLASALRSISVEAVDPHLVELEQAVQCLEQQELYEPTSEAYDISVN